MNNTIIAVVLLLVIGAVLYSSWGTIPPVLESNKECIFLNKKKVEGILFGGCFDIWHISHFVLWFIVGILAPNYYIQVIIISIIWELIEDYSFKKFKRCDSIFCGRIEDIFINIFSYSLGSYFKNN